LDGTGAHSAAQNRTCSGAVGKILSSSTLSTSREQIVQRRFSGAVIIRLLSVGPAWGARPTIGQRCALPGRYQLAVSGCAASAAGRFSSVTGPGGTVNGSQSAKPSRRDRT
jgi:hypothetical protein